MTTGAILNAFIYLDSHDFTGDSNQTNLTCSATQLESSNFRSGGWAELKNGLKSAQLGVSGHYQAGSDSVDEWSFTNLAATGKVLTTGLDETEGSVAYMMQSVGYQYQVLGSINEMAPYQLTGGGSSSVGAIRGRLLKEYGTVSSTGAIGTAVELGAVSATQFAYSTIHLFGTAGTSITVLVESDADDDFGSATTQITHGSYTTAGGRWGARKAGAITDTWWRARVSAISGTWVVAVAAGIR